MDKQIYMSELLDLLYDLKAEWSQNYENFYVI